MQENIAICPVCGTLTATARGKIDPSTNYGTFPQASFGEPQAYERGYTAQAEPSPAAAYVPPPYRHHPQPQQTPPAQQQLPYGYAQPIYNNYTIYTMPPTVTTNKNDGALIAEILFSLFGVFGIGWLIGGETTTGVLLLIGSFVLYWPIIFGGTLITFGLGLLCLGPLAIGLIILNAILLNNKLKRKATTFYIVQPPPPQPMHMPPRPQ
jgi:hypothetical protein